VLIYIIKKKKKRNIKKELWGHKPNPIDPHKVYAKPNWVIQRNKNNTGGCVTCSVWTNRQHGMNPRTNNFLRQQQVQRLFRAKQSNISISRVMRILKPRRLYRAKLREGERFYRQHGYITPRLQPIMLQQKASLPFLAKSNRKQLKTN